MQLMRGEHRIGDRQATGRRGRAHPDRDIFLALAETLDHVARPFRRMDGRADRDTRQREKGLVVHQPQFAVEQREQLLAQRHVGAIGRRTAGASRIPQLVQDRGEQRLLTGEVVIDGALRHVRARSDTIHARRIVARGEKFLDRRIDDGRALSVGQTLRGSTGIHTEILHRAVYLPQK